MLYSQGENASGRNFLILSAVFDRCEWLAPYVHPVVIPADNLGLFVQPLTAVATDNQYSFLYVAHEDLSPCYLYPWFPFPFASPPPFFSSFLPASYFIALFICRREYLLPCRYLMYYFGGEHSLYISAGHHHSINPEKAIQNFKFVCEMRQFEMLTCTVFL